MKTIRKILNVCVIAFGMLLFWCALIEGVTHANAMDIFRAVMYCLSSVICFAFAVQEVGK